MAEHGLRSLLENVEMQLQRGIYDPPMLTPTLIAREAMRQMRNNSRLRRWCAGETVVQLNEKLQEGIYG